MAFGNLFGRSSNPSSPTSPRPNGSSRPPLGPGSSKLDYAYSLNPSDPQWPSQSYNHGGDDAPPAYRPQGGSEFDDWATGSKKPEKNPASHNTRTSAARIPAPDRIHIPTGSKGEDPLLALKNYDIVIILDDSFSMTIADNVYKRSRWDQAWDALRVLVQVGVKYDRDGIEIHFLNNRDSTRTVKSVNELDQLRGFVRAPQRESYTPTGDVLDTLLLEYRKQFGDRLSRTGVKKKVFIVITDGAASDAPEDGIINAAKFFQKNGFPVDQVGIQFIQVGNDPEAEQFLDELDTDLVRSMGEDARDMVDTIKSDGQNLTGETLIKALTGGFNRKQDRKGEQ